MKLYIGNLPNEMTDDTLSELMVPFGTPSSTVVIKDRDTGASRGFGFVEFSNDDQARAAMASLNGREVNGRTLKVNEARPSKGR